MPIFIFAPDDSVPINASLSALTGLDVQGIHILGKLNYCKVTFTLCFGQFSELYYITHLTFLEITLESVHMKEDNGLPLLVFPRLAQATLVIYAMMVVTIQASTLYLSKRFHFSLSTL